MRRQSILVALAIAPAIALSAGAQLTELQPGARVRIQAPGIVAGRFAGTVLTRTADTLVIGAPNATPVRVPIDRISSAEVSRGSSRSLGAVRGIEWGAPIGLVLGVIAAAGTDSDPYCFDTCSTSDSYKVGIVAASTVAGVLWGAGIGALIGRERWDRFDVAPRTSFDVRRGRASLGFAVGF
ncbi:MAG: hypothetical protein ACHQRK_04490 [Gemmatimonadales bacterium]